MSRARDLADRVLHNRTHEDTDGGRESIVTFKGEQSGGEISTLAQIQASHDGTADDQKADLIFKTNDGSDGASPTEAARIDSSQNLLVGHSTQDSPVDNGGAGVTLRPQGVMLIGGTGTSIYANREDSDGEIVQFRKDGSTVGTVGTQGSRLSIGSGDVNLNFNASANSMYPISNPTTGAVSDGIIDVGAATARFKDLYLSGGAYIGGTVAANKLEDYEEGTWTPTSDGTNPAVTTANYTKIGNIVHIVLYLSSLTNSTGNSIHGLPFTPSANTYSPTRYHSNATDYHEYVLRANSNSTSLTFLSKTDGPVAITTATGSFLVATFTYQTDA